MPSRFEDEWINRVTLAANRAFGVTVTLKDASNETGEFTARRSLETKVIGANVGVPQTVEFRTYIFAASILDDYAWIDKPVAQIHKIVEGGKEYRLVAKPNGPAAELLPGDYEWEVYTERDV